MISINTLQKNDKLTRTTYFSLFFAFPVLYNFFYINSGNLWKIDEITYAYHLVDYSMGFCTRLLPGAVFRFIFKNADQVYMTLFETVLLLLSFAIISYFLSGIVSSLTSGTGKKRILMLFLMFLCGPLTFAIFTYRLGMLDVYWVIFSILLLLFLSNKYFWFLIPAFFVTSVLIHISFSVSYFFLFIMILLYKISTLNNRRQKNYLSVITTISIVITIILVLYFIINEKSNLNYSLEEFNKELFNRYEGRDDFYEIYYDYSLYGYYKEKYITDVVLINSNSGNAFIELIINIINRIYSQIHFSVSLTLNNSSLKSTGAVLLIVSPLIILFYKYWIYNLKQSKFPDKFVFVLAIIQFPLTFLVGSMLSPDLERWLAHAFLIQFTFFIYVIYHNKEDSSAFLINFTKKINVRYVIPYSLIYALTIVDPYCN